VNSNRVVSSAMHENIHNSMHPTRPILNIAVAAYTTNGNMGSHCSY
jgi:hypothetical protein